MSSPTEQSEYVAGRDLGVVATKDSGVVTTKDLGALATHRRLLVLHAPSPLEDKERREQTGQISVYRQTSELE